MVLKFMQESNTQDLRSNFERTSETSNIRKAVGIERHGVSSVGAQAAAGPEREYGGDWIGSMRMTDGYGQLTGPRIRLSLHFSTP